MAENANIEKFKCDILSNFQTMFLETVCYKNQCHQDSFFQIVQYPVLLVVLYMVN